MYRPLVSRSTRAAVYPRVFRIPITQASRKMTTTPPAHPERSNTLIVLSALGALGGLYYYYTRGQPAVDREAARRMEEETERKVREVVEAGKNKVQGAGKQGQRAYNETRATVQDSAIAARTDLADRARQSAHEAQVKLDELKSAAEQKMGDARDRSEKTMEESKEEAARRACEAGNKARGWFGWGGSK